jgi:ferredoxin
VEAFQERLPEMVKLVKAISIAELEIDNLYKDSTHDPLFRTFDEGVVEPDDLALFPTYLVCLRNGAGARIEKADLIETLSLDLPVKVLVQSDDIVEELSVASGGLAFGAKGSQLAVMALGLNNVFVLQSSGSGLYRLRDSILRGLANHGPALFSVFSGLAGGESGSSKNAPDVTPYLRAAAAMESRALPAFTYDPGRGDDWASRFSVDGNPQPEADWPLHRFVYEDEDLQRVSEEVAFTFVDFAAADGRYAGNFAGIPRSRWLDGMVPVNEFLDLNAEAVADKVPYILMVDDNNVLHRAIVEDKLIGAARRCREMWRSLQELAGINNSHARILLAKEKEIWQHEKELELAALKPRSEPEAEAPAPPPDQEPGAEMPAPEEAVGAEEPEVAEATSDEPYIETPRCTTCDECTEINNRMFAYDDNKQAYIADLNAGTYRQMVEAAESCQVAIIHPGKPVNPDEANLAELLARAEPFN